jgi:hypothetical protein
MENTFTDTSFSSNEDEKIEYLKYKLYKLEHESGPVLILLI